MVVAAALFLCLLGVLLRTLRASNRQKAQRHHCLDACVGLFDAYDLKVTVDGFARLTGRSGPHRYRVGLIPDTMTIKRLPQLWLSLSMSIGTDHDRIAVTARPRPDDFFSSAADLRLRVEVPNWLPSDLAIRSDSEGAEVWVERNRVALQTAFSDPLLKEIALDGPDLRLIYRLAEGDRGQHLLFRQSNFAPHVSPDLLLRLQATIRSFTPSTTKQLERAA